MARPLHTNPGKCEKCGRRVKNLRAVTTILAADKPPVVKLVCAPCEREMLEARR